MDHWECEGLRSANYGMRNQIEGMLDTLARQQELLPDAQSELAALRVTATSKDELVAVTVDSVGALVDVRFEPAALRKPPRGLAEAVLDATGSATEEATARAREIMAPIEAAVGQIPALSDLVPGAENHWQQTVSD